MHTFLLSVRAEKYLGGEHQSRLGEQGPILRDDRIEALLYHMLYIGIRITFARRSSITMWDISLGKRNSKKGMSRLRYLIYGGNRVVKPIVSSGLLENCLLLRHFTSAYGIDVCLLIM